jgi:Bacterial regulatory proteins, luxR family
VDYGKVPWPKLREYLLRVGSRQTRGELMRAACLEVQMLIPFDVTADIFNALDMARLEGIGPSDVATSYNSYYRTRQPFSAAPKNWSLAPAVVDWRGFGGHEFAVDFMWPNGMWKSLQHTVPGQQILLAIQRSRSSPAFTESDVDTLGLVNEYLNDIYSGFDKRKDFFVPALAAQTIAEKFCSLSRREAEVCSLVACRFNTAEIAISLFISRRTVEKHLEVIFDKLDVRSREQLRWRLGVTQIT